MPTWTEPVPPSGHPAAFPASTLGAVSLAAGLTVPEPDRTDRPFLSVVTRTQGLRLQCLGEMLTCLAAQTSRDFEVVLVCHRVSSEAMGEVTTVLEQQPDWLRERVRIIGCERPGRAAPLNDGFNAAEGRYVVALDDDDTVLGHWVETFRNTEERAPGTALRASALRQDVVAIKVQTPQGPAVCPVSAAPAFPEWPLDFSIIDHLRSNYSPFMTVAFPRGVVHGLGLRFDEALATTEDWHFLVRTAALIGVTDARELTSVYRWWPDEASKAAHDETEWKQAHDAALTAFDEQIILLPPGHSRKITELLEDRDQARGEVRAMATSQQNVIEQLQETAAAHDQAVASRDALQATVGRLEAQVAELQKSHDARRRQQEERLDLMQEAHALLASKGGELPEGRSLFDLNRKQLRGLIERLQRRGAGGKPPRLRLFRQS